MNIRPFDYSTADYERYVSLRNSIVSDQPASVAFEQRTDREWPEDHLRERVLVLDPDGRARAAAEYNHMPWSYHLRKFGMMIFVREDARRKGLGSYLFECILEVLAPHDPLGLESQTREDWPDGVRFLEKREFRLVNRGQQSELDPAGFDPDRFNETIEAVVASGLTIRTLGEVLAADPDTLHKLYDMDVETQPDMPWYDEMTAPPFEEWVKSYEDNPDLLYDGYIIALDGDEFVGHSQLWGSQAADTLLYTGMTAVRRPYRRRGLATAMKVRALQYAQSLTAGDGNPPKIVTTNEESNPMLQINLRLGFQERPAWLIYHREEERS